MKKIVFLLAIAVVGLVSCKKETIEPAQPQQQIPNVVDTTGNGTLSNDTLAFDFIVETPIASSELDSVVIEHIDASNFTTLEVITILPSNINNLGSTITFNALQVDIPNTIVLTGLDQFKITIHLNTSTNIPTPSANHKYEFGINNAPSSNMFNFGLDTNGKGTLVGLQMY